MLNGAGRFYPISTRPVEVSVEVSVEADGVVGVVGVDPAGRVIALFERRSQLDRLEHVDAKVYERASTEGRQRLTVLIDSELWESVFTAYNAFRTAADAVVILGYRSRLNRRRYRLGALDEPFWLPATVPASAFNLAVRSILLRPTQLSHAFDAAS